MCGVDPRNTLLSLALSVHALGKRSDMPGMTLHRALAAFDQLPKASMGRKSSMEGMEIFPNRTQLPANYAPLRSELRKTGWWQNGRKSVSWSTKPQLVSDTDQPKIKASECQVLRSKGIGWSVAAAIGKHLELSKNWAERE